MRRIAILLASIALVSSLPSGGDARRVSVARETVLLVAWSPDNLPRKAERSVDRLDGVASTSVLLGLDWLTSSRRDGKIIDSPPSGYAIPVEIAYVKPNEYARYVGRASASAIQQVGRGEALLASTAAKLRRGGRGLRMTFRGGHSARAVGLIPDRATQGFEALMAAPPPSSLPRVLRSLVIQKQPGVPRKRIVQAIRSTLAPGQPLRVASERETHFLRYAEVVHPHMTFKKVFGEFAARPGSGTSIQIAPGWVGAHIVRRPVPILGEVTCHKRLFRQLRGALAELRDRGLAHLVRTDEYAGCYNSRYVAATSGARLSRHSWGIALDINARSNPYGARPNQDARLVKIMRGWGFTWGGTWPTPDSMHFEWHRFP